MVIDFKLFTPGEPLRDGLFTVLEQIPGQVRWDSQFIKTFCFFYIIKKLSGYNNWKNSSSHLKEHASTKVHISCTTALITRNNATPGKGSKCLVCFLSSTNVYMF